MRIEPIPRRRNQSDEAQGWNQQEALQYGQAPIILTQKKGPDSRPILRATSSGSPSTQTIVCFPGSHTHALIGLRSISTKQLMFGNHSASCFVKARLCFELLSA